MVGDVKKLSSKAPIILTWVPKVRGASLPNGKNSALNYLEIIKNHKLKNKEERDIYLVINGPGFKENQIDNLKHELKEIKGVHVVDLHQYNWSKIDQGWKIDGKDISIKDFFKNMYNMTDEQRTYFAIEIDTFRLIALALVKQFAKQGGAIYIDFDALKAINGHIGKGITIPKGILLGHVGISYNAIEKKVIETRLNNDLIAVSNPNIAVKVLSEYKSKVLSQKEMCGKLVEFAPFLKEKLAQSRELYSSTLKGTDDKLKRATILKEGIDRMKAAVKSGAVDNAQAIILKKESDNAVRKWMKIVNLEKADGKIEDVIKKLNEIKHTYTKDFSEIELQEKCLMKFSDNPTVKGLYEPDIIALINIGLNLGHHSTLSKVHKELIGSREQDKWKLFSFPENNGNYVPVNENSDLSWTKQVSGKLEVVLVGPSYEWSNSNSQPIASVDFSHYSVNNTLTLLDLFVRKIIGNNRSICLPDKTSEEVVDGATLIIVEEFDEILQSATRHSGIQFERLEYNPQKLVNVVDRLVKSGADFNKISKALYSEAEKACKGYKQSSECLARIDSKLEKELKPMIQELSSGNGGIGLLPTMQVEAPSTTGRLLQQPSTLISDSSVQNIARLVARN